MLDHPDVLIRPATDADLDALVDLDLASARHHASLDPGHLQVPEREPVAAFLNRRLANRNRRMLVAIVECEVVGTVDVTMTEAPDPGSIYRSIPTADLGITVAEGWRNRGIGQALMAAAELDARARGARQIILDLHAANDGALRLYQRLGYETYGLLMRRDLYPPTDDEPAGAP